MEQGWVSLLERRLHAEKFDYKVVNASISGETTFGGVSRIQDALKTHRPVIVILELGANDGLRGADIDAVRSNLEAIADACRRAGARTLLIGMHLPPNYGTAYAEKFRLVFSETARRKKLPLVPLLLEGFAGKREYFQADGIHPTAEAQPMMLNTVWKELLPLLKRR